MTHDLLPLSRLEARIVGSLIEADRVGDKPRTLSLGDVTRACNLAEYRVPVMDCNEAQVRVALERLVKHGWVQVAGTPTASPHTDALTTHLRIPTHTVRLVIESRIDRIQRYRQNAGHLLKLNDQELVVLALLLLQGPQTLTQLCTASPRLNFFADAFSVQSVLDAMMTAASSTRCRLVMGHELPGQGGTVWGHTLCARRQVAPPTAPPDADLGSASELEQLRRRQTQLLGVIDQLNRKVQLLEDELTTWREKSPH
jgi:uncharacterized protein YceH (UPF0502 family)